ncbi:MAG: beta-ribofuranosylaminobenzene 5'-phosphate synthase [ANME-2 cluster archaeon]|nr:beta-ribofuranosylaminobenzene 5'-phosphate synthase [ANME-2 cluster archaeon]MDF1557937.1 beta-ribofuranosylaminobenzene 5'-phosphate synthase [ANME-2 cluster archaeon]
MIQINTPSRLHMTLIDLNASLGRVDGGVGLTLDDPSMRLSAEETNEGVFVTGSGDLKRIKTAAELLIPQGEGIHIKVEQPYSAHVGLGSGTQSALAAGWAVNLMFGLGLSVREVATKVGRGGTSGIGVESFEHGGFIVDGGHRFADKGVFSPSAASRLPPGPVLFRHDFPAWPLVVAIPDRKGASSQREVDIFKEYCPVPLGEVQAVSHIILMNMLSALIEADMQGFGDAINRIQEVGFKQREVGLQNEEVRHCMDIMREQGAYGAGMSSFGPTVFALAEDPENVKKAVSEYLRSTIGGEVFITSARNTGAKIMVK